MYIFACIYGVICLWRSCICFGNMDDGKYLSVSQTQAVKGVFILIVFLSHTRSYVQYTNAWDVLCVRLIGVVGQSMVTLFLFYSGYGVMESIRKKGNSYIATMPTNRILATCFRFDCAVLLFAVLSILLGQKLTVLQVILSLIGWESVGNSNWYIFAMLVLYAITWLAFWLTGSDKPNQGIFIVLLGTVAYVFVLSFWNIKEFHWYDTVLCYVLGMAWSLFANSRWRNVFAKWVPWTIAVTAAVAGWYVFYAREYTPAHQIAKHLCFTVAFVLVTMRVRLGNPILNWCGKHLFPLYILQRIPMIIGHTFGLEEFSIPLFILFSATFTVIMVYPFEYLTDKLWNALTWKRRISKM